MKFIDVDEITGDILNCTTDRENAEQIEITNEQAGIFRGCRSHNQFRYTDGQIVPNPDYASAAEARKARALLIAEKDGLELQLAKGGLVWLIKDLIKNSLVNQADVPQQLITAKNRIEAIEAELGS